MKKVLMWTGIGVGAAVGTYYAIRGMRGARGESKKTADAARSDLETTQKALHAAQANV